MWVACEAMVNFLSLIVSGCVLNQNQGHWLILVVLQFVISRCRDIRKELTFQPILDSLVEKDFFDHELKELEVHMKW
jgi:hypothetical protein